MEQVERAELQRTIAVWRRAAADKDGLQDGVAGGLRAAAADLEALLGVSPTPQAHFPPFHTVDPK